MASRRQLSPASWCSAVAPWSSRTWARPPCDPSSEPLTALSNGVITMTAPHIVDPSGLLGEALVEAYPDLMRSLLQDVINALLSADADAVVGAEYGRPSAGRSALRNGYRHRDLDTRIGAIHVTVPTLHMGTHFPDLPLE